MTLIYGTIYLPPVLAQTYHDDNTNWDWQHVFPATKLSVDPRSGVTQQTPS